jgi:hypothetical protein
MKMKTKEILILRAAQAFTIALGATVLIAIGYAIIQMALGNYQSTACREF